MGERVEKKERKKALPNPEPEPGPTEHPSVYPPADEAPNVGDSSNIGRCQRVLLVLTCSYVSDLSLPVVALPGKCVQS